jgi:hypothetical protein
MWKEEDQRKQETRHMQKKAASRRIGHHLSLVPYPVALAHSVDVKQLLIRLRVHAWQLFLIVVLLVVIFGKIRWILDKHVPAEYRPVMHAFFAEMAVRPPCVPSLSFLIHGQSFASTLLPESRSRISHLPCD